MPFDDKAKAILKQAVPIFYERGYGKTSIRDIASRSGISPAAIYYYFKNKEDLLYHIQKNAFAELLSGLDQALTEARTPAEKLRALIRNHLRYFIQNMQEMKILSHESDALSGAYRQDIQEIKRAYVQRLQSLLEEDPQAGAAVNPRVAALLLFGMMNWIYTWYRPAADLDAEALAATVESLFLHGLRDGARR